MQGYIHSFESFGTVDGPGVRYVVFFQGCPMRCRYCHNPDTWKMEDGTLTDTDEIIANVVRNLDFYRSGGLTATGGEPMFQLAFLTELFEKAHQKGIHTCLDTSGIVYRPDDEAQQKEILRLLKVTDLVMLDIKHMDEESHRKLTGHSNQSVFAFAELLKEQKKPLWIRHVVVPGITYQEEELTQLGRYLKTLPNFEHLEVLPYHSMAVSKYENLGIDYPLQGVPQLTKEEAKEAERIIMQAYRE